MIISCSFFLQAEHAIDARKLELFNTAFNAPSRLTTQKDQSAKEEKDDFDVEEWARQYLNMRTVVACYLPVSSLINPYIVGKFFNKEFLEQRPIKMLPITKSDAICLPLNAVVYILGNKFLNKKYPIKNLVKQAAIDASNDILQSLVFAATDQAVTYLPSWSRQPVAIGLKGTYIWALRN